MSLQFRNAQIANAAITPAKLDTASAGLTYNFAAVGLVYKSLPSGITLDSEVATKAYVDSVANGAYWKDGVTAATTTELDATYNNGSSGVGATLTNSGTNAAFDIDNAASALGGSFSVGDRVLIKNQSTGGSSFENGIYEVTTVGDGSTAWVLTRTADQNDPNEFISSAVFVAAGDTNANIGFVCTTNVETIGTDAVSFTAFTGTAAITAGAGLSKSGSTIDVEVTANAGLGFSAVGDSGTLEVKLTANEGLVFTSGSAGIQVDYDNTTIGIISNKLAVKDGGVGLAKLGAQFSYDEFNTAGGTIFTLANAVGVANYQSGANVRVYLNGQRLRVGAMNTLASSQYTVFQDGSDTKICIKDALISGEILQADYLR